VLYIGTAVTSGTPLFIVGNGDDHINRSNAMVVLKNGNVGIGENAPDVSMHLNGAISFNSSSIPAIAATVTVTVANKTYLRISSNDANPANRKVVLTNGLTTGQMLIIQCVGGSFRLEDADTNLELQGTANYNLATDDTISLIWDGGEWVELHRSDN
jgi:hypothetical protein